MDELTNESIKNSLVREMEAKAARTTNEKLDLILSKLYELDAKLNSTKKAKE